MLILKNFWIKKVAAVTLLAFLGQNLALCDDDDPNANLKKHVATLKANYQTFVESSHTNLIRYYFLQRSVDFYQAFQHLSTDLLDSQARFETATQQMRKLDASMGTDPAQLQKQSIQYHLLMSAVEYEKSIVDQSIVDLGILRTAWEQRCTNQKIADVTPLFVPDRHFVPDQVPSARIADLNYQVSFGGTYQHGGAGGGFSGTLDVKTAGVNEVRGISTFVASSVATGVSSYLIAGKTLAWSCLSASAVTGPGILVGMAVAAVMSTIFATIDVSKIQGAKNEQSKLLTEAWLHQRQVVTERGSQLETLLREECRDGLTGEYDGLLEVQQRLANLYQEKLTEAIAANQVSWQKLKDRFSSRLSGLENWYFPRVNEVAADRMDEFFVAQREKNAESRNFLRQVIRPHLDSLQRQSADQFTEELEMKHRLWDEVIHGDATYSAHDDFHFGRSDGKSIEFKKNKWNFIVHELSNVFTR